MLHAPNMMVTDALRNNAQPGMFGALSGAIAAATAADADVCGFVNKVARALAIPSISISAMSGTNFTNPAAVGVKLFKATGMTINADGTSVAAQLRKTTGYDAITIAEMEGKVSTTAALTPGARTLAAQPFHVAMFGGGQAFAGQSVWEPQDGIPLALEIGEGIVAQLVAATPAGGTVFVHVGFPLFRF